MNSLETARKEYRQIQRRSEQSAATFNAAVEAFMARRHWSKTPENFLEAARAVRFTCGRCAGTGIWAKCWDVSEGTPRPSNLGPSGTCFRCQGKGSQDDADRRRNYGADLHYMARGVA